MEFLIIEDGNFHSAQGADAVVRSENLTVAAAKDALRAKLLRKVKRIKSQIRRTNKRGDRRKAAKLKRRLRKVKRDLAAV